MFVLFAIILTIYRYARKKTTKRYSIDNYVIAESRRGSAGSNIPRLAIIAHLVIWRPELSYICENR